MKLDDDFFDHIKVVRAGRDSRELYLAALLYASKSLTDGFVPVDVLDYLAAKACVIDPANLARRLVQVHLWEEAEGGFTIHDYHDYNPLAQKVRDARDEARERMRRNRANGHDLVAPSPTHEEADLDGSPEVQENIARSSDTPYPVPYPVPVPVRKPPGDESAPTRAADAAPARALWSALVGAGLPEPITRSERAKWNAALKELAAAGVSTAEAAYLAREYESRWPHLERSPNAIASNLSRLRSEPRPPAGSRNLIRGPSKAAPSAMPPTESAPEADPEPTEEEQAAIEKRHAELRHEQRMRTDKDYRELHELKAMRERARARRAEPATVDDPTFRADAAAIRKTLGPKAQTDP